MASEERKQADARMMQENLFKSLGAGEQEAETDAFQCGRCKEVWFPIPANFFFVSLLRGIQKRKTRYRQAQTRSADEPMTVRSLIE